MKILKNGLELKNTTFLFPAGEVGATVDVANLKYLFEDADYQTIVARIQRSNDVMQLALLKDALERFDDTPIRLVLPYVPYTRQDRVCNPGDPFSLKVFANLINSMGFERVTIIDPHSDVCGAVFDDVRIITQQQVIERFRAFSNRVTGTLFVSPDAGANKKTSDLARYFNHREFIRADKLRDMATGAIKETIVYADDLTGRDIVIADDICDGGRTFIELAKVLKSKGAQKVILYVTHGIFTKGTDVLYKGGIDEIYTTNSYFDVWPGGVGGMTVLDIEEEFVK